MPSHSRPLAALALAAMLAACSGGRHLAVGPGALASNEAVGSISGIRAEYGLPPLAADPQLEKAALQQARFMAQSGEMEHTTGRGRDFATRMKKNGVGGLAAENIAHGRYDVARVLDAWMHSPPHRRNMLDARMTRYGLASVRESGGGQTYWALVLAK